MNQKSIKKETLKMENVLPIKNYINYIYFIIT